MQFSDNFPPHSVNVKRWNAAYATGSQDISNVKEGNKYAESALQSVSANIGVNMLGIGNAAAPAFVK